MSGDVNWLTCTEARDPRRDEERETRYIATLIETGVLQARFDELNGVVLEVEVDLDVAHAVLLGARLGHRLLEVAVEAEHLLVERHPRRQVETVAGRNGTVRSRHPLTREPLAADARLRLADVQCDVFVHVEVVRLVKLGLSHLRVPRAARSLTQNCVNISIRGQGRKPAVNVGGGTELAQSAEIFLVPRKLSFFGKIAIFRFSKFPNVWLFSQ